MKLDWVEDDLHRTTTQRIGDNHTLACGDTLATALKRHGFLSIPDDSVVAVAAPVDRSREADVYAEHLRQAAVQCRVQLKVRRASFEDIQALEAKPPRLGAVVMVGVGGSRGDGLTTAEQCAMSSLERRRSSYRLFSLDNKKVRWSAFDQLSSLIQGVGSAPFLLELPVLQGRDVAFVGVDLGHPHGRGNSWVAISIVDKGGSHQVTWRAQQPRDETVRPMVLTTGLEWVRAKLNELSIGSEGTVVLRDGRLHKGERFDTYRSILQGPLSFIEVAKGRNPEIVRRLGDKCGKAPAGVACQPKDADVVFYAPIEPVSAQDLPPVMKMHMARDWDGLEIGTRGATQLLTGLAYSAGLGLRPHVLPGPLYWANGIASIKGTDHKFSGQKYHTHGSR